MAEMFSSATAYEATMGRWSARLAPLFVHFAAIPDGGVRNGFFGQRGRGGGAPLRHRRH
jgi:hypothetical protein